MESRDADEHDISTKTGHTPDVGQNNKRCQGPYTTQHRPASPCLHAVCLFY